MATVKKKPKVKKAQDGWLENLLRFEIVVLLFGLIGFYYFLSFSPIRMPKEPIASPRVSLAPLPPASEPDVPALEESTSLVDDAEISAPPVEVAASTGKELDSGSRQDEIEGTSIIAAGEKVVAEVKSRDKVDDKLTPPVASQGAAPSNIVKPESVETELLDSSTSPGAVAVSARTDPAPAFPPVNLVVEVGSYLLQSDLQKFRSQIEALGFTVKTESRKRPTPMSRVFLGPYSSRQKAKKMMAVARGMGDKPFLRRGDAGYIVIIGSCYLDASVVAWVNMYRAAGLDPKIEKENLLMLHTLLLIDGPKVARNPEEVLAQVQAAGFPQAFLRKKSPTSAK